jgi:hypothetical protein
MIRNNKNHLQAFAILLLSLAIGGYSWSNTIIAPGRSGTSTGSRTSLVIRFGTGGVLPPDNEDGIENIVDAKPPRMAEYGVSYIGGDPCGSKYNDDPFDAKTSKPGMPDDMKARIQALAEKKMRENDEKGKQL